MLDETTSPGDAAAPPLPVATADPPPAHRCNRPGVGLPAITASPSAEMPMKRCDSEPEQLEFPWPRPAQKAQPIDAARFFVSREADRDPELRWGDQPSDAGI